jgi:hypothetical protein
MTDKNDDTKWMELLWKKNEEIKMLKKLINDDEKYNKLIKMNNEKCKEYEELDKKYTGLLIVFNRQKEKKIKNRRKPYLGASKKVKVNEVQSIHSGRKYHLDGGVPVFQQI